MAKICNHVFRIFGEPFETTIFFHPSKNQFVVKIPDEVATQIATDGFRLGNQEFTCETFDGLIRSVDNKIKEYEDLRVDSAAVKKVIVFGVELAAALDSQDDEDVSIGNFPSGVTMVRLRWRVLAKQEVRGEFKYKDPETGHREWPERGEDKEIEWTQDRENFFHDIEARLKLIATQFHRFFEADSDKLASKIDSGGVALLTSKRST